MISHPGMKGCGDTLFFINGLRFPAPKFSLGQAVKSVWTSDDRLDPERYGKQFVDYGLIVGLEPIIEGTKSAEWGYHVYWLHSTAFPQNFPLIHGATAESHLEVWE